MAKSSKPKKVKGKEKTPDKVTPTKKDSGEFSDGIPVAQAWERGESIPCEPNEETDETE